MISAWTKGNAEFLAKRKKVGDEYMYNLQRQAEDVEFLPPTATITMLHNEAQYLTMVGRGATLSFLCRSKTCLFYGYNHQWIQEDDGNGKTHEHFRCPSAVNDFTSFRRKDTAMDVSERTSSWPTQTLNSRIG